MTFLDRYDFFFISALLPFLYFCSSNWLSFALCKLGGPQRTCDVLAPS